jgi:hypothetical protein
MNKILLLLFGLSIAIVSQSFGQSFEVYNENDEDISGTTINISGPLDEEIGFEFKVLNTTALSVNAKFERCQVDAIDETTNSFCVNGSCVMPSTSLSPEFTVDANATLADFSVHYNANGNAGTSTIRYKFFNVNNVNDTIDFTIIFNASASVENYVSGLMVTDIYPNPAVDIANIDYNLPANSNMNIVIYNILGKEIMQFNLTNSGRLNIPVSDLQGGTYFCRYNIDGETKETQKLIIK